MVLIMHPSHRRQVQLAQLYLTPCDPTDCSQAPLSMGFSQQEYWSGLPFPSPEDLPNPGTQPVSSVLAGGFFTTEPPGEPIVICVCVYVC